MWTSNAQRLVAWHIKDGTRLVPQPLPPVNPFTQVVTRPPRFASGGDLGNNDALYTGEGSIGKGYPVDPDPGVVGFKKLFDDVAVKGAKFYIVESDNAIGPVPADPGRSLRHAKLGIEYLLGLRTGPNGRGPQRRLRGHPIRERGRGGGRVVAGGCFALLTILDRDR